MPWLVRELPKSQEHIRCEAWRNVQNILDLRGRKIPGRSPLPCGGDGGGCVGFPAFHTWAGLTWAGERVSRVSVGEISNPWRTYQGWESVPAITLR